MTERGRQMGNSNIDEILAELSELEDGETFPLWYDGSLFYGDADAPENARWIGDLEKGDSREFILSLTQGIMAEIKAGSF